MEYPPCNLVAQFLPKEMGTAPLRRGVFRGLPPPIPPEISEGASYLYKKPLAPWARIKLTMTRADYREVIAMSV